MNTQKNIFFTHIRSEKLTKKSLYYLNQKYLRDQDYRIIELSFDKNEPGKYVHGKGQKALLGNKIAAVSRRPTILA